jgi:transaldolase/glucose-6-phosphate isomerase
LGWLVLPEMMHEQLEDFVSFAEEVKSEGKRHVVLLGMGGSSLAPEVFQKIFDNADDYPELIVLDSTHPSAIRAVEDKIDLRNTLFLVSSKSGTTIETISLFRYFWNKMGLVDENQGRHFVAITDADTPLTKLAQKRGFRKIFLAPPDVGGRYSALTVFGLLPAALIGMDVHEFLDRAWIMSENCAFCVSSHHASGLILAAALGELAKMGRDKVTFLTSPSIRRFPVWLEQLIAESLGKDGKGIVPIVNEPMTSPKNYGADRFFIYFSTETNDKAELKELVETLEAAGHPVIRINLIDKINISQEIFCWEMGVAAAGAILEIHPFNQPNVQMAKDLAKKMMDKAEKGILSEEDVETVSAEDPEALAKALKSWLSQAKEGDYVAIQAYLAPTPDTTEALQKIRLELLNRLRLATTLGYGPRFLHSTGQLHKGGPNNGLFLQLIDEPIEDLEVPETNYTFGTLIQAQALGDYQALKRLGRRVLRINLKRDVAGNLSRLAKLLRD